MYFIYKIKHSLCPRTICDMFLTNSHTYNLRQKDVYRLVLTQLRTENTQFDTYNVGARRWSKTDQARTDRLRVLSSFRTVLW